MNTRTRIFAICMGLGLLLTGVGLGRVLADEIYVPLVTGSGSSPAQAVTATATNTSTPLATSTATPTPTAQPGGDNAECPASDFLTVTAHPANSAYPAPYLNVTCTGNAVVIESNGIPNFEFVQLTPNQLQAQDYRWEIPLNPTVDETPEQIPLLGVVAIAVNGMPIYGPNEAANLGWGDPVLDEILDFCNGHTGGGGAYHFHARPECLFTDFEGNTSLVVAYALDGYPILAPFVCQDSACTAIAEVQSSWQRTSNAQAAWDAHEYVAGSGDLDRCNGMTLADGSYAYFATDTFPYFLACYHGVAGAAAGSEPGGGPGGGPGGPPGPNVDATTAEGTAVGLTNSGQTASAPVADLPAGGPPNGAPPTDARPPRQGNGRP